MRTATLDEPEHGLTDAVLAATDVLTWWGHVAHGEVSDEIVDRVQARVLDGMGLIVLHSGHFSKIFKRLMGTTCDLKWREADDHERIWVVEPGHPIAEGLGESIELDEEEMYGEHFDIPAPDELVFVSWFKGGEVFRSGCCYQRVAAGSSTSARATRAPDLLQPRCPAGDRQRRALGVAAGGRSPDVRQPEAAGGAAGRFAELRGQPGWRRAAGSRRVMAGTIWCRSPITA